MMRTNASDIKFALIGGGSYGWTYKFITDIASIRELHGMHIVLQDINPQALAITAPLCQKISAALGADLRIEATGDLKSALVGSDFVGLTISTGGDTANALDLGIPLKYGIAQTVGDTVGPGGWSRALRNVPVVVNIIQEVEKYCPGAWFFNYSNPMTILTRTLQKISSVKSVGLCHELQGLMLHLAYFLGAGKWDRDIQIKIGGINHLIFALDMQIEGRDGLALLRHYLEDGERFQPLHDRQVPAELIAAGGVNPDQHIKFDFFQRYGYLPCAGDTHTVEFFSHYLHDAASIARWNIKCSRSGHTFAHIGSTDERKKVVEDLLAGRRELMLAHSHEHASLLIAALLGVRENLITPVNTANIGQIDNLPRGAVVETQALVNANGITPLAVGKVPPLLEALLMRHIPVQEMIVQAALTGDRELALHALSLDPLVPSPEIAYQMGEEFFQAFRTDLPQFHLT